MPLVITSFEDLPIVQSAGTATLTVGGPRYAVNLAGDSTSPSFQGIQVTSNNVAGNQRARALREVMASWCQ